MFFSTLQLNEKDPIYLQIEKHIIEAIEHGELVKASKLPSTRECSKMLGVSRNSVLLAYQNLESQGFVKSVKGKGTFVERTAKPQSISFKVEWENYLSLYGRKCNALDIIKTEPHYKEGMISFKSIAPEGKFFDVEEFKKALLEVLAVEGEKLLNYGYAKGYRGLMQYLMEYMEKKGVRKKGKDLLITNGFTEGLDIILSSLTVPGDVIICEKPTHQTALKIMAAYGIQVVMVPMDQQGMQPDALREAIEKWHPKFTYLIPSYHNPTGIVMSGTRRRIIYKMLSDAKIPILEDGFNEELLYLSTPMVPLAALAGENNNVVYIGSLSKILFPGLRIGWIMADEKLIDRLESVKRARTIHTSFLDQAALMQYMKSGAFERYVKKVRKYYREKYLFTIKQIKNEVIYESIWGEGGLHVFIKLNDGIDTRQLLDACVRRGVLFMPGDLFYNDKERHSTLRIGFARLNEQQIIKGIKIIGEEIKKMIKNNSSLYNK